MGGDLREEEGEGNGFRGGDLGLREGGGGMSELSFFCVFLFFGEFGRGLEDGEEDCFVG